jgi:hypothetical protein
VGCDEAITAVCNACNWHSGFHWRWEPWNVSIPLFDLKYPGGMFPGLVSLTGREAGEDAAILGRDYLDHQSITSMCVKVSDEMKELYD